MEALGERLAAFIGDRYTIGPLLGEGGMACVYRARDRHLDREVAVKVMRTELGEVLGATRFLREVAIAASLSHPHIVPVHDSGSDDGLYWYVMPRIDGESLQARLDREPQLPPALVARLGSQVARALDHAHTRGVIHRDIKPANILLAGDDALITDFGIARALEAAPGAELTATGLTLGTPAYMSPEQAAGGGGLDGRSDIYALGCVLYEMVAGRPPFSGPTPMSVMARHVTTKPDALGVIRAEVPAFLEQAVARALAKDPAERFATAAHLAEILERQELVQARHRRAAVLVPTVTGASDPAPLAIGLHEALIGAFGGGEVAALGRTSMLALDAADLPLPELGRRLQADLVVESSVLLKPDEVIVQVRLLEATDGEVRWSTRVVRDPSAMASAFDEAAVALGRAVSGAGAGHARTSPGPGAVPPAAFEAYLRGRVHQQRFTPQDFDAAQRYYEAALAIAPGFPQALAGLGLVWGSRIVLGIVPPAEAGPQWQAAAVEAVNRAPDLAEARQVLGQVCTWYLWEWDRADGEFRQAVALDPNDVQARTFYAHLLSMRRRYTEAEAQMLRALEIDPYNPFTHVMHGMTLVQAGRDAEALDTLTRALEMVPDNALVYDGLAFLGHLQGDLTAAAAARARFFELVGQGEVARALRDGVQRGDPAGGARIAADLLASQATTRYVKPTSVSQLYDWAGEVPLALDWLERGFEARDHEMAYLATLPRSADLTRHPGFLGLLDRLDLPRPPGGGGDLPAASPRA